MCSPADLCLALLAVIFPPIAVWIKRGLCSADSLINLALCLLGFLPGLIHAWYIISATPSGHERLQDEERGVVHHHHHHQGPNGQPQRREQGALKVGAKKSGYGSIRAQGLGQPQQGNSSAQAPGSSAQGGQEVPPSYAEVVGDHKVQSNQ